MPAPTQDNFKHTLRFFLVGVVLLLLVIVSPLTFDQHGHSFLKLAQTSSWRNFGDWLASWYSFKVIGFGLALMCLVIAGIESSISWQRERFARIFSLLMIVPVVVCLLGCYDLIKSLL